MARAVKAEPEETKKRSKKTGFGTILNRLFILALLGGNGYFYWQTTQLQGEVAQSREELRASRRDAAANRIHPDPPPAGSEPNAAVASRRKDYLAEAQADTKKAEQALAQGNVGDAWRASRAATEAAQKASNQASEQTQKSLDDVRARLDSVQTRAAKIWHTVGG